MRSLSARARRLLGQAADALLHYARKLPAFGDVLGEPSHALRIGAEDGDRTHVVEEILGRHRLGAHARFAESDVLGDVIIELVGDHRHRHPLFHPVGRERVGRIGRRRDDVRVGHDLQKIGRMAAARALDVVHVDGAAGDRRHRVFAEAEFVDRVGVQVDGEIVAVGGDEALIDHRGRGAEILMDLHRHAAGRDQFLDRLGVGRAAPKQRIVERRELTCLQEAAEGGGAAAADLEQRPRAVADHRGRAARQRMVRLFGRTEMGVRFDCASGDDIRPRRRPARSSGRRSCLGGRPA